MGKIAIRDLAKSFDRGGGEKLRVLDGLTFTVEEGGFYSILGPSGCGKTTLLRIIAGIEESDGGEVSIGGRAGGSTLSLIYQQNDLLPWLTVRDNVAMAVRGRGPDREGAEIVEDCLARVGMRGFEDFYPSQLSGGMEKRTSLARALAADADVILCDEPLAFLDFRSRLDLQGLITDLYVQQKKTILYVTHDIHEAIQLSRRTLLLTGRPARIEAAVDIPFGYPRDVDGMRLSKEFRDLVAGMEGILGGEGAGAAAAEKRGSAGG